MDVLQRYRELRSMGFGESRAKATAAIEHARSRSDLSVDQASAELGRAIEKAKEQPTRAGGLL